MKGDILGLFRVMIHPSLPFSLAARRAASTALSGSPSRSSSLVMCSVKAFISFSLFCENCMSSLLISLSIALNLSCLSFSRYAPLRWKPRYVDFSSSFCSVESVPSLSSLCAGSWYQSYTSFTLRDSLGSNMMSLAWSDSMGDIFSARASISSLVSADVRLKKIPDTSPSSSPAVSIASTVFSNVGRSGLLTNRSISSFSISIPLRMAGS